MDREMKYLLYRCVTCHRVITKLQMKSRWEKFERDGIDSKGICVCGSGKVSPTNATTWEELSSPSIWKLWVIEVVIPWLKSKL